MAAIYFGFVRAAFYATTTKVVRRSKVEKELETG